MRLGLGLYGLHPRAQVGFNENLSPALRFVATIINKKTLPKGECVSYGCTYTAPKDMEIGVVSAGYYDGVDRRLSNRGHFVYKGQELPILGRVCMNLTIVDLTGVDTKIGDEIEILGIDRDKQNWVRKVSDMCETIPYDILVGLAESIRRVLVD
jgi:alanine racemase